jgi:hypothetical protein
MINETGFCSTQIPEDELWTMPDPEWFQGKSVLELGNKKNQSGLYRDWYVSNGAEYQCLDWNGEDGAIPVDMGKPLDDWIGPETDVLQWADIVTNFGFTEHVFTNQEQAWRNVLALASSPECHLSVVLPFPTHWDHHGVYQPTPGWLEEFVEGNGFKMNTFIVNDNRRRWVTCIGATRIAAYDPDDFFYPDTKYKGGRSYTNPHGKGIYITPPGKRVNKQEKSCGVNP